MKEAILAIVAIATAYFGLATSRSFATDLPASNTHWRETTQGLCLEISQVSEPFPGPAGCAQIGGRMNELGDLMIGYACTGGSEISFFSTIQTDNTIKPDIFIGTYSAEAITAQYCTRLSNDWPPEYNCERAVTFSKVDSCKP